MKDLTTFNFESVDNGRVASKDNGNKLTNIADSIKSIKLNIPAKIANRCSAGSILSGAASIVENSKKSCDNISDLCEQMINLYKNIDYTTSEEIMKAFSQSLLLFDLGFLSLEDLKNLYERDIYVYDENGKYVKASYEMILGITDSIPLLVKPLGGGTDAYGYIVVDPGADPAANSKARVYGDFAYRMQAIISLLSDLGIHVPIDGGFNPDHKNPGSLHRKGLALDFDPAHSFRVNYNNGADEVTICQNRVAVSESANNVFYNTIDCSVEKLLYGNDYNRGLYAKVASDIEVPAEYQKYVVNGLQNVVQITNPVSSNPSADNISLVSLDGTFIDMNKLYADEGIRMSPPLDNWKEGGWAEYESHHVEMMPDYTNYPKLFDSTGTMLSDYDAKQYGRIVTAISNLD